MTNIIVELFSYDFLIRAMIVGALISLCASLLGVNLVLKRYSMIGDGLSHVGFGAMAVASALNMAPLAVAVPVCVIAAFLLLRLSENSVIKGDAAIAMVSSGALAIGVMVVSMTTGMNTDIYNYMFGSILALDVTDTIFCVILSVMVIIMYIFFLHMQILCWYYIIFLTVMQTFCSLLRIFCLSIKTYLQNIINT